MHSIAGSMTERPLLSPSTSVAQQRRYSKKAICRAQSYSAQLLQRTRRGIQYVEHTEGDTVEMFKAVCMLGLEGIVSKKVDAPYRSGLSKVWLKVKNPDAPAAARAADGTI
jgi:bifunctional non-homologous end joining protein LigD